MVRGIGRSNELGCFVYQALAQAEMEWKDGVRVSGEIKFQMY